MAQTLQVFRLVGNRLFSAADQELLTASMQDGVVNNLKLAQFTHELDVAKHFPLGHVLAVLLQLVGGRGLLVLLGDLDAVLELIFALLEQEALEGAGIALGRVKVGGLFHEKFAQLCVHRRILGLIEGFFEN